MRFVPLRASLAILVVGAAACASEPMGEGGVDAASNVVVVQEFPVGPRGSPPLDDSTEAVITLVDEQPTRWGGVFAEGDSLVITYVGQTREEALRAIEERAGSATYIEVRPASVSVSDLKRAKDVVVSVLRDEREVVMVYPSYSEGSIHVEVTGDAVEAANVLRGKVPGPVRVLVKGGATPATPA